MYKRQDESDDVFRIRDLEKQIFENTMLQEFRDDKEIRVQILNKNAELIHSGKAIPGSILPIISELDLEESEIYILLLSNDEQKLIKKFLFRS